MVPQLFSLPSGPKTPTLGESDVHVWCASLDAPASQVRSLQDTLAADELSKAGRYHFQIDRDHFIVARGRLREILGRYLKQAPQKLCFSYGPYGKPALVGNTKKQALHFNVSHSHGMALYAITREREIGVDLERVRPEVMEEKIAEHFFSPREVKQLHNLPENLQTQAFFTCWTRKEAYIKARGEGLQIELDSFDVSITPGEPAALLRSSAGPEETSRWSIYELDAGADYAAALVVEEDDMQIKCWQWSEP
jgi:4'-phosphopantetheinyl transferase